MKQQRNLPFSGLPVRKVVCALKRSGSSTFAPRWAVDVFRRSYSPPMQERAVHRLTGVSEPFAAGTMSVPIADRFPNRLAVLA